MDAVKPEDVRVQLDRLYGSRHFRGPKLKRILEFLVEQWLAGNAGKLTLRYIGESLQDEPLTFEEHADRWSFPKTRVNLMHVRNRLLKYNETVGYYDRVTIKLVKGSYVPQVGYNKRAGRKEEIGAENEKLIVRAKIALDQRNYQGGMRAAQCRRKLTSVDELPRVSANFQFIRTAGAAIVPCALEGFEEEVREAISGIRRAGIEPWECCFADACARAAFEHDWEESWALFERARVNSQEESVYYWWHTALMCCRGHIEAAIDILDAAVKHFGRSSLGARTDLAMAQILAGRHAEAEETLLACFEFAAPENPVLAFYLALVYEAQDRVEDAATATLKWMESVEQAPFPVTDERPLEWDMQWGAIGMYVLAAGRAGLEESAKTYLEILLGWKAESPRASSSIEIAIALIGVERYDEAIAWLRKAAFEESDPYVMWLHIFPPLRHLRRHRGFRALLKELRLPHQRPS